MNCPQPTLSPADAVAVGRVLFEVACTTALSLGSERDQAFMLLDGSRKVAVLKVSNEKQDPTDLDMESEAAFHAKDADRSLPIITPRVLTSPGCSTGTTRALWTQHHYSGTTFHWCRCYTVADGICMDDNSGLLPDGTLNRWGAAAAQVDRSLRRFWHPAAHRKTLWDVQHFSSLKPLLIHVEEPVLRAVCSQVINYFDSHVAPKLPLVRHQIVHGDLNLGNILWEAPGSTTVTGIIDFGDACFSSLVVSLGAALASGGAVHLAYGGPAELLRMGRLMLDGYQSVVYVCGLPLSTPLRLLGP